METVYKVNNIFDENGLTLDELISNFLLSFLDSEWKFLDSNDIINSDITSSL